MYTIARIQTGTGTIKRVEIYPTAGFIAALQEANAIVRALANSPRAGAYQIRLVELLQV